MAGSLISALLGQLSSITAREAEQEIRLVIGVDEEVRRLEGNLRTVLAVLDDAEKRQVEEHAVSLWLEKLKEVSYEMDDVLDEWSTAMIKLEIEKEVEDENAEKDTDVKKVCSFIPSLSCCSRQVNKLVMRHDIAHKIKQLNEILDKITREREMYGFESTRGAAQGLVERPKTTSFVDVSDICGRDRVMDDLVSILLGKGVKEEEQSPPVFSLVGMGGIGKTSLAQVAYNHDQVKAHFDKRIWVCVSEPFDQCAIAKAIIQAFGGADPNITELQSLLEKICELIGGKKFFLILDDVWTEDDTKWVSFKEAFKCGSQGSRILVTTRKERVANKIGSVKTINLEVLSEEDCWLIFKKIAFFNKDPTLCQQLENVGRKIAEKCKGLPLAAKTLGSLMRFKNSKEEWKRVLDSCWWEIKDEEIKSLYAPLLLSYYDLSSPLRQCFKFCAVFSKDYVFSRDELVYMWMAQGYIMSNTYMEMEIMAQDYFEKLAMRSFFQDFEKDKDEANIKNCKMHDIVHDFAQLMSKNECFIINFDMELASNYKNARHLRLEYNIYPVTPIKSQFLESIYCAQNLRTLYLLSRSDELFTSYQHFRCLRALTLNGLNNDVSIEFLGLLEILIHLRYLNLVNYYGSALPETICNLCNLQILKIKMSHRRRKRGNYLQTLPQGMSKLINLRHFILDWSRFTKNLKFPRGFGRLTSLRTLTSFGEGGEDDSERGKLGELRNLNHLQGSLKIYGLGSDVCEANNAQLKKKIGLRTLELWFNERDGTEIIREEDALVLNALEPPPDLEDLTIQNYLAPTMFPNWMMSLTNLKKLEIWDLSLEHLPPLGKLLFLESLTIRDLGRLKKVGAEFLGIEESEKKETDDILITLFPNLISLTFCGMYEWEEWNGIGGEEGEEEEDYIRRFTIMPRLQNLTIESCMVLKSLPNFLRRTTLQHLVIVHSLNCEWMERTGKEISNCYLFVKKDGGELRLQGHEEESDGDDDKKEESNEDEVDKEEDDKALHDKKEDDEAEHL
ncbi:putative disease resistance protein RGA1 [Castanea sativa]|uniref:putative disease resistance protein RGA1 n=1 Tax=Castanea sativa TaxID=21020 RepID=UPI003F6546F6